MAKIAAFFYFQAVAFAVCICACEENEGLQREYSFLHWVSNRGASIPVGTRFCFAKSSVLYLCFRLTRKRGGGWWWNRPTTTTWEARITATGNGVDIDKVEYSDDGKHYLTGTSFTSDTEITKFYIRVTDSKGNVTKWLYENGKVTQK